MIFGGTVIAKHLWNAQSCRSNTGLTRYDITPAPALTWDREATPADCGAAQQRTGNSRTGGGGAEIVPSAQLPPMHAQCVQKLQLGL
ncbi:MAG: hypothetical protein MUC60_19730 [Oscillatoria sp. Prado101]|nr:hypothetical protein [Oscillatoria sp. Prado101]